MPKRTILGNPETGREVTFWFPEGEDLGYGYGCQDYDETIERKLFHRIRHFLETGVFPRGKDKFKPIEGQGKLYAIKCFQHRFIGVWNSMNEFVVLLCVKKQRNKYRPADLKRARLLERRFHEGD